MSFPALLPSGDRGETYAIKQVWWLIWEWRTPYWAGARQGLALGKQGAKGAARGALRADRTASH